MDRACVTSSPALPTFAPLMKLPLLSSWCGNVAIDSASLGRRRWAAAFLNCAANRFGFFYVFRPGHRIVLLDGMVKKRNDIPHDVLERVRQLLKEVG